MKKLGMRRLESLFAVVLDWLSLRLFSYIAHSIF